jgi:hypothetical protein
MLRFSHLRLLPCLTSLLAGMLLAAGTAGWAATDLPAPAAPVTAKGEAGLGDPWSGKIESEWGGYLKIQGSLSWPDEESLFQPVGPRPYTDGSSELRLKNKLLFGSWGKLETHYEAVYTGGDTRRQSRKLERQFPALAESGVLPAAPLEDDRRFFDLTKTIDESDDHILYHRLDRLALTLLPPWGSVTIGRQALTWGNGLIFNPMDLFNPFAPTDIERDYKVGDDMVNVQVPLDARGNLQFLYVPRRNPATHKVERDQSSLAGKLHFSRGTTEFDLMAAEHYDAEVVGLGSSGYLGDAAWRLDAIWTSLDRQSLEDNYLSLVANMDYSWVWWGKNVYGFVEFFYNGLGKDNYPEALSDPDITERLARGELFTLGRTYLSGHLRVELHPLFNVYLTAITNLADPSGILQPRATWDVSQNVQITAGGNIFWGEPGTEYGGFPVPGTNLVDKAPDNIFLWLTYYF